MPPTPIPVSSATLPRLADRGVSVPGYEREGHVPRIVHIGVGGFHRAHQARYLDELAAEGGGWRICGVGARPADRAMADALLPQDCLYTLVEHGDTVPAVRVIGSIVEYRLAAPDPEPMVEAIARPETAVVSLTITESGYGSAEGEDPGVFEAIAVAASRRAAARMAPITILSCDNVLHNGEVTREATLRAARRVDARAARWLEAECTFPSSMVDRITPATTDGDRAWLRDGHGIDDRWPVVTESFRQWVIEDRFASDRPPLERVGAIFTDRVGDWETYKLRMLNATHSALAYLAALAGVRWVDEALRVPELRHLIETFLHAEVLPTIDPIAGHPPADYAAMVLDRFSGNGVRDQIARLCIDGTTKMATFLMPTIEHQVATGGPIAASATALAAWARYLASVPVGEQAHDPFGDEARRYAQDAVADPPRFLAFKRVFPPRVATDSRFRDAFSATLQSLAARGPLATAAAI